MNVVIPPWLENTPQTRLEAARAGAEIGLKSRELSQQATEESIRQANQAWSSLGDTMAQRQMQKQALDQKTNMDLMQMNLTKQEQDRQFQLQQQQVQNEHAIKQQQLDLQTQEAARAFQWNQLYQQRVKQYTSPSDVSSADVAGAGIAGAPAPTAGEGMDYNAASVRALSEIGPPPGESMAGFGASIKAMQPQRAPLPASVVTGPNGEKAWYDGNKLVPIKPPTDTTEKDDEKAKASERKDKIQFINNFLKNDGTATIDDAMDAYKKLDEGGDAPAPSVDEDDLPFKIIKVGPAQ